MENLNLGGSEIDVGKDERLTKQRLASVQTLLGTERRASEHDVLIATALESLRGGPKTEDEIFAFACETWPGAGTSQLQLHLALVAAREANLIGTVVSLDEISSWQLTNDARADLAVSEEWADRVVERCHEWLKRQAYEQFEAVGNDTIALWMGILLDALLAGIRDVFARDGLHLEFVAGRNLSPRGYDLDLMQRVIDERADDPASREFLYSMIFSAMDPSNPFGNELVHTIATGYVLYSFLSRRDNVKERELTGSLRGKAIILDTPVLLRLMGHEDVARIVQLAIKASAEQSVRIILHEETIEEFQQLLERVTEDAMAIESDLAAGLSPALLASVLDSHPISLWLGRIAKGESLTWRDFVNGSSEMLGKLTGLGIETVQATAELDLIDAGRVTEYRESLKKLLMERGGGRGSRQIDHDAYMLMFARRLRQNGRSESLLPDVVIVTTDSTLSTVYRRVENESVESFPIALTLSQWIAVVSTCTDPSVAETLAIYVPGEVAYETLMSVAVRFPVESSRLLAKMLTEGDADSQTDVRVAQMTIDDLLESQPNFVEDPAGAANQVASAVIAKRGRRLSSAYEEQRKRDKEDKDQALIAAEVDRAKARIDRDALQGAKVENTQLISRVGAIETNLTSSVLREWRKGRVNFLLGIVVMVIVICLILGLWWISIGSLLAMGMLWRRGDEWAKDPSKSWLHLLVSAIPEIVAVMVTIIHF